LVRKADTAMYWGKQNGRGVITFFSDLKEPDRHLP
jgi:predicted signal transduction protein with EAL and GGDEF domain